MCCWWTFPHNTVPKVRLRCHPSCLGVWVTSCISSRNTSSACVKMVCIGARQLLQLQTTKANQLIISGTRFFGKNLGISFTGNLCCRQSARLWVLWPSVTSNLALPVTHLYPCALDWNSWIGIWRWSGGPASSGSKGREITAVWTQSVQVEELNWAYW